MQTSRCHWHWFQTNWTYNFSLCYLNGKNLGAHFEGSCRKREQKFRRKMPGCFAVECQHHSMRNPLPDFSFPNSRFSTEKVVAFVKVRVFVCSRVRQYDMPSISQWLRIRYHLYVWYRYTLFHISFEASLVQSCVAVRVFLFVCLFVF